MKPSFLSQLLLLTSISVCTTLAQPKYNVKYLGTLGGDISDGRSINDTGQITGNSQTAVNAAVHAFLHDGTTMRDLGTLGGTESTGFAVNRGGQVTGVANTAG